MIILLTLVTSDVCSVLVFEVSLGPAVSVVSLVSPVSSVSLVPLTSPVSIGYLFRL